MNTNEGNDMANHQIEKRISFLEENCKTNYVNYSQYLSDENNNMVDLRYLKILKIVLTETFEKNRGVSFEDYRVKMLEVVESHNLKIKEATIKKGYETFQKIYAYFNS